MSKGEGVSDVAAPMSTLAVKLQRREVARRLASLVENFTTLVNADELSAQAQSGYNLQLNLSELCRTLNITLDDILAKAIARCYDIWAREMATYGDAVLLSIEEPTFLSPEKGLPCANEMCRVMSPLLKGMVKCANCGHLFYCSVKCRTADLGRHRTNDCKDAFEHGIRQVAYAMQSDLRDWKRVMAQETPLHAAKQVLGLVKETKRVEGRDELIAVYYARWKQSLPIVGAWDVAPNPARKTIDTEDDAAGMADVFASLKAGDEGLARYRAAMKGTRNPDWCTVFLIRAIGQVCNTLRSATRTPGPEAEQAKRLLNELAVLDSEEVAHDEQSRKSPPGTTRMYMRCSCCLNPTQAPVDLFAGNSEQAARALIRQGQSTLRALVNGIIWGSNPKDKTTAGACWIVCSPICLARYTPILMTYVQFGFKIAPLSLSTVPILTLVRPGLQGVFTAL